MQRVASLVLVLCLTATLSSAAYVADNNVDAEDAPEFAEPQVLLVDNSLNADRVVPYQDKAAVGWGRSTRRPSPSTRRPSTRWPWTSRGQTTTRRPTPTTRRPTPTTRRPTTTTRRPTTTPRSHDQSITWGGVYPYDVQLATRTVYKAASWMQVNTLNVDINAQYATIHCIQVVDQLQTGKNAVVSLTGGGVGQRSARLRFDSKRGEPISYLVIVWGK